MYRNLRCRRPLTHAVAAAVLMALLAACGSSGSNSSAPTTTVASSAVDAQARALLPTSVQSSGVITVASSLGFAPFDFLGADGKTPEGVDQDLIRAVAPILGVKFDVSNVNYGDIVPGMQAKRYLVGWSAVGEYSGNESVLDFATYIVGNSAGVLVNAKKSSGYVSGDQDSLCGKSIAQVAGETASEVTPINAQCAKDGKPQATVKLFQTDAEVAVALESGQLDVRFSGLNGAYVAVHSNGQLAFVPNVAVPVNGFAGVAVLAGQTNLIKALGMALQDLINNGQYAKILTKWSASDAAVSKITYLIPPG